MIKRTKVTDKKRTELLILFSFFLFFFFLFLVRTNNWDTINRSQSSSTSDTGNVRKTCSIYDSAIDEHFKRSLGPEKYAAVFHATGADKEVGLSGKFHNI